jgi:hypothetical protein
MVEFLKQVFEKSIARLSKTWKMPLEIFSFFTAVYLLDSTHLALNKELKETYTRSGNKDLAGIKLQTCWDYLHSMLAWIDLKQGKEADQGYTDYLAKLQKDNLILFDLAYVAKKKLKEIMACGAYFLCRYNLGSNVYDQFKNKIDLEEYLCGDLVDMTVRLTKRSNPIRLIAKRLPKEVSAERLANITRKAADKGKAVSKGTLKYIEWQIYLTNIPQSAMMSEVVCLVYRLRWQIELLFKLYKSVGELNQQPGKTTARVLGEIYAKLIGLVLFCYLTEPVYVTEQGVSLEEAELDQLVELSAVKALKIFKDHALELARILYFRQRDHLSSLLTLFEELWLGYGVKGRQLNRKSTFDMLHNAGVALPISRMAGGEMVA